MPSESKDLIEARELLGIFEAEMGRTEGLAHLVEGLSLLTAVREEAPSVREGQVATNIAMAYARKVGAEVESLLSREPLIHQDIVNHWQHVFSEFELAGFSLPPEVAQARSQLSMREAERAIKFFSPSERKKLLELLQALNNTALNHSCAMLMPPCEPQAAM